VVMLGGFRIRSALADARRSRETPQA
jgi:hypothetical protein